MHQVAHGGLRACGEMSEDSNFVDNQAGGSSDSEEIENSSSDDSQEEEEEGGTLGDMLSN